MASRERRVGGVSQPVELADAPRRYGGEGDSTRANANLHKLRRDCSVYPGHRTDCDCANFWRVDCAANANLASGHSGDLHDDFGDGVEAGRWCGATRAQRSTNMDAMKAIARWTGYCAGRRCWKRRGGRWISCVRAVTDLRLGLGLLLAGCSLGAKGYGEELFEYRCDDLVVVGRVANVSATPTEAIGDVLGRSNQEIEVRIAEVLSGIEERSVVSARIVAHSVIREDLDLVIALAGPDADGRYSVRSLGARDGLALAASCSDSIS